MCVCVCECWWQVNHDFVWGAGDVQRWIQTTWRLFHNMVVLWPMRSQPACFHSCGRQYRKVWKVAIETASTERHAGPRLVHTAVLLDWRNWGWFHNAHTVCVAITRSTCSEFSPQKPDCCFCLSFVLVITNILIKHGVRDGL